MDIRNFCIIAHIDHGKSTLADRFLEITNTVEKRDMKHGQLLDTMDLEQERGITIKLQPVRMEYEYNQKNYILNLIDTPGHVDFTYEVSRSLAACEGAILVVDASQGIEAQTVANIYLALENDLEIIPVMNKIDLPSADPDKVGTEISNILGVDKSEILSISAKEGTNVEELLQMVIDKVPAPATPSSTENKALIFDSVFDPYRGAIAFVRVIEGSFKKGQKVQLLNTKKEIEIVETGYFKPQQIASNELKTNEVGYIVSGLKDVKDIRVGDTVWKGNTKSEEATPLKGYKKVKPFVFAGVFCTEGEDYPLLRDALDKLSLSDSALVFEPESSSALGHGFRCGFLGLLHLEIVQERLEREYNLDLIVTAPSVSYKIITTDSDEPLTISNPSELPEPTKVDQIKEPWVKLEIISPKENIGHVMELCEKGRGVQQNLEFLNETRSMITYEMPLASIVSDFFDRLKNITSGYGSMNYEFLDFRTDKLVKVDILIAGDINDALSFMCHKEEAYRLGATICKKLKAVIPRAQFEIALQSAIGGKIIARETIPAMRKDVTAKLYGGDRSRKDKLLKKQKKGKKRMKQMGKITLPQEAFLTILKKD